VGDWAITLILVLSSIFFLYFVGPTYLVEAEQLNLKTCIYIDKFNFRLLKTI